MNAIVGKPGSYRIFLGRKTSHNAPAINTPPYTCAIDSGSSSSNAPHSTPNGGIMKVTVIDLTGPMDDSRRK